MLDYNPFAHLSLIILTESTLIGNKLEFLIWNVVYFFYSMIKVYNNLSLQAAQKVIRIQLHEHSISAS